MDREIHSLYFLTAAIISRNHPFKSYGLPKIGSIFLHSQEEDK